MQTLTIDQAGVPATRLDAPSTPSKTKLWTGRIMTGLPLLFLAVDGAMKLALLPQVVEASAKIGYTRATLPTLGVLELLSIAFICLRRTRLFGAVLVTAYLGGAVATHVRLGDPLLSHTLFPVYFAALIWGGIYLRDARLRALSPFAN